MKVDIGYSKNISDITHGVIAIDKDTGDTLHFVGFWGEPSPESFTDLRRELTDEMHLTNFDLFHATDEIIQHFIENTTETPT